MKKIVENFVKVWKKFVKVLQKICVNLSEDKSKFNQQNSRKTLFQINIAKCCRNAGIIFWRKKL